MVRIGREFAEVRSRASCATFGSRDYLDVSEVPGIEIAANVSPVMRIFGNARTEIWAGALARFSAGVPGLPRRPGGWPAGGLDP